MLRQLWNRLFSRPSSDLDDDLDAGVYDHDDYDEYCDDGWDDEDEDDDEDWEESWCLEDDEDEDDWDDEDDFEDDFEDWDEDDEEDDELDHQRSVTVDAVMYHDSQGDEDEYLRDYHWQSV